MEDEWRFALPAYIIMAIARWDVFLVQITVVFHRVPGPSGVISDPAYIIPVISGTCIVHHVV